MIAVLIRDLRLSVRSGGGFGLALAFFAMVVILVPFSQGTDAQILSRMSGGILWIAALLACLLSLDRIFALDFEDGTLEALVTTPLPLEVMFLAKATSHWVTTGLPVSLAAPILGMMLGFPSQQSGALVVSLLLGTPALSLIGAFGAALTVGIKRGGLLLSLLILPLFVPTLIFGALAVTGNATSVLLLSAVSLACLGLLPFAGAASLRMNLR